ncbi:glycosyltransferase family 4 protein [Lactococcus piscium]|uniref:Glycosyltransferase family 4 protein n=2 Tax=Pseudolactococcus paracarnosus TaxID=2749962 RepID=A0ABT0AML1_9LACT|nr:glycosyltransferase family 4 protein [Lactococcus paracarnosus]MCJ1983895.1 glycosyltransferase family 4 protein [Lactococcus paracarnosus]MCJ1998637.1 glycosyltransferase family 4 protein [Lactococcus paracarnosus]
MRILHYGLGYPPERTGGLVQYVTDLMIEQVKQNHEVAYLFPGRVNIFNSFTEIKKSKMRINDVTSFEIINSLPLAVFGGIKDPSKFQAKVDRATYNDLLNDFKPDVIHVHSLMGIHKEFFEVATDKKIKIIYTSHDYFGLSPNPTFYFNGRSWDEENDLNFWLNVSQGAIETKKLKLLQLPFYSNVRDIIKKFKKSSFQKEKDYKDIENEAFSLDERKSFEELIDYYQSIFKLITLFHFNSSISKTVFERNLVHPISSCKVLSISNSTILGGRKHIKLDMSKVKKITYIGQYAEFKGFTDFISLAEALKDKDITFEIYGENIDVPLPSNVINKKRFSSHEKEKVFKDTQLLIIPSRWKETFGFLGLEALDNNCPVFVNKNIGMKDLITENFIFSSSDLNIFLKNIIRHSYQEELTLTIPTFSEHTTQVVNIYK